jgi:hypothetical protein
VSSEYEIDDGHHVNNEAKKDKENNLKWLVKLNKG